MYRFVVESDHLLRFERGHRESLSALVCELHFVHTGRPALDNRSYLAADQATLGEVFEQRNDRMHLNASHGDHLSIVHNNS